jgi:hypothetical protein
MVAILVTERVGSHTNNRSIFNVVSPTFNHLQIGQIRVYSNRLILLYFIDPIWISQEFAGVRR